VDSSSPEFLQHNSQRINDLLKKYFVTKKGMPLGTEYNMYQKLAILRRTMQDLENMVEVEGSLRWHEQRDREEDLGAKLTREEDLRSDASFKRISLRDDIDLERFWINPQGQSLTPSKDLTHYEWLQAHPQLLSEKEKNPNASPTQLFEDGWIRISGGVAELSSENQMYPLAEFLIEHVFGTERDSTIMIVNHKDNKEFPMKIGDIIERYGDEQPLESQGSMRSISSRQVVTNPLRKNLDYGPEWQSRVKEEELHDTDRESDQ
jgi:hypothetical protein